MNKSIWLAVILTSCRIASHASGATYYISSSSGSDANTSAQARSKATPWAHLPCMANATGNTAAYTPVAGDVFVLKGGDSWTNASFPCVWQWSGAAGAPITFGGVDPTWFAGNSWTRPIFTAGGSQMAGPRNLFISFYNYIGGNNTGAAYITVDNIEFTGFNWTRNYDYGYCAMIFASSASNLTLDHLYVHGWTHGPYPQTMDGCITGVIGDTNPPFLSGSVIQNSVWDGSDSTNGGDMGAATYAFPSAKNNVMHDMPNFLLPVSGGEISGNLIYNCKQAGDPATHENMLETLQGNAPNGTFYIHDNVFHDSPLGCETAFLGNPGEIDYVWNNVWYNVGGNQPQLTQNTIPGVAAYLWNNTIVPAPGQYCFRQGHTGSYSIIQFLNNHCITTNANAVDPALSAASLVINNNVLQTPTVASALGYTAYERYAYSPVNSPVGAGSAPSATCGGPFTTLCNDTSYGQGLNASTESVTGPARTAVSRLTNGVWNVGAYQVGGNVTVQGPLPPTQINLAIH